MLNAQGPVELSDLATLALISDMLIRATSLILTGLAVAFTFQAGILNIGAEGQLLIGTACLTVLTLRFANSLDRLLISFTFSFQQRPGGCTGHMRGLHFVR